MRIKVNCKHFDGFVKCNFKPKDKILYWNDRVFWEIKQVCVMMQNCMSCEDQDKYPKPQYMPPPPPLKARSGKGVPERPLIRVIIEGIEIKRQDGTS